MNVLLCLTLIVSPALHSAVQEDQRKADRAKALMDLLAAGKFDAFCAEGDETMKAGFQPAAAAQLWANLKAQLGDFKAVEGAQAAPTGGHVSVTLTCRFTQGTLKLRFVLDDNDRLAGLWVDALDRDVSYEAPSYVDRAAFEEVDVTVDAGSFPLEGTLSVPKAAGRRPCVVLVHGSGPHDQDETVMANKPFRDLAWGLASRGVAVLRYEKRTKKYPRGIAADQITLDWETIDDALAAAKLARTRPQVDPKRVFVAGHSLGGFAGPEIARRDPQLAGLIIIAGTVRPILDVVTDQLNYLAAADGTVSPQERAELNKNLDQIAKIRAREAESLKANFLGAPGSYWLRLNDVDSAAVAATLELPILIVQGGRDYQASMKDFEVWKQRLAGRKNVTFALFEKLNHLMIAGEGPSAPAEYGVAGHVDEALIERMAEWIRK
ncbi:MAG: alpha/beta fold hydrolase [Phycisphaerales bacterium]|nr:MAG: alpha/beta fold hydrolase [Phycisphaerales bacterium]